MNTKMSLEEIINMGEGQYFDRKSSKIQINKLAETIIAFANADGRELNKPIRIADNYDFFKGYLYLTRQDYYYLQLCVLSTEIGKDIWVH